MELIKILKKFKKYLDILAQSEYIEKMKIMNVWAQLKLIPQN